MRGFRSSKRKDRDILLPHFGFILWSVVVTSEEIKLNMKLLKKSKRNSKDSFINSNCEEKVFESGFQDILKRGYVFQVHRKTDKRKNLRYKEYYKRE